MAAIETDICVIGAGSGGLVGRGGGGADGRAGRADRGRRDGRRLPEPRLRAVEGAAGGGQGCPCDDGGCAVRHRRPVAPQIDFGAVKDHVARVIATIAPVDSQERFEGLGVQVIRDWARFISPAEVQAGGDAIRARRFVIATGSRPVVPPISGAGRGALSDQRDDLCAARKARRIC